MDRLLFTDITGLSHYMLKKVGESKSVSAALFFDAAKDLMKKLLAYDCVNVDFVELHDESYCGYEKEYYITLSDDYILSIKPAFDSDNYLTAGTSLLLIDGDASSRIIKCNKDTECIEINFRPDNYKDNIADLYLDAILPPWRSLDAGKIFGQAHMMQDLSDEISRIKLFF